MITQERLHDLFDYDGNNLIPKIKTSNRTKLGKVAGYINNHGYRIVGADGTQYLAHRLIWLYVFGGWPKEIDHINRIRDDNRIENIRNVDSSENNKNLPIRKDSKTGIIGVCWATRERRWRAVIFTGGKQTHLITTSNLLDAACARKSAEIEHGFHENHGRTL